jgi:hypothetical protein
MVLRAECYLRRAARLRVKSNNHFWRLRFKEELNSYLYQHILSHKTEVWIRIRISKSFFPELRNDTKVN